MPNSTLDRLTEAHGIALSFVDATGKTKVVSHSTKRSILAALGVSGDYANADDIAASSRANRSRESEMPAASAAHAFMPTWLDRGRAWGIGCQLYALRSERNCGMGDFEDLARLAEFAARHGADFLGVNPLHALFFSDPARCSPYSPSSRRFLNPLYIAVDKIDGAARPKAASLATLKEAELIDYPAVAEVKRPALLEAYRDFCLKGDARKSDDEDAFQAYRAGLGESLADFALFEALSEYFSENGRGAGSHDWPADFKDRSSAAVAEFGQQYADRIRFHEWLQWTASCQLSSAHARAVEAGMRIGLYLDLAVGVAADGADTWCAPDKVLAHARIGAPPDEFNEHGQDWGLAPLSPIPMRFGLTDAFTAVLGAAMASSGAMRLDHAMALQRLYFIPDGAEPRDGTYVNYPLDTLLNVVAGASNASQCIVIGEDLGTVPPGFRDAMRAIGIQGYRVLLFERDGRAFRAPDTYDRDAIACVSTHDLPTLAGWWCGNDIAQRLAIGLLSDGLLDAAQADRSADKCALVEALEKQGLLSASDRAVTPRGILLVERIPEALVIATHAFLARSPCRLVTVQIEDLVGVEEGVNIPGTIDEHPNWRRRLPVDLDQLADIALFTSVCATMSRERPRIS